MALKSTIYKAQLSLADMDRGVYGEHNLTLALHPSETEERLMVRLLAYALHTPTDDHRGKLEFARPVVYRAAYSLARGDAERGVHVSMAKAAASDAAQKCARVALQAHGAIGYSFEYDLHLWMKRAWALAAAWGDAAWHRNRVATVILDGESHA